MPVTYGTVAADFATQSVVQDLDPVSIVAGAAGGGSAGPSLVTTAAGTAARQVLVDPTTGNASLVQAFHNTDNQVVSGTSYGLFTGGVDQIINGAGNLDRKRGVSGDGMAITGLAAEVPMVWNGATFDRVTGSAARGQDVALKPSATAPAPLRARIVSAASTNATSVKASAGNLYHVTVGNVSAGIKFLKLYDKASAPTVGTDTPIVTIPIPIGGFSEAYDFPIPFAVGIAYAITGAIADSDTTAVAANDVHGLVLYA